MPYASIINKVKQLLKIGNDEDEFLNMLYYMSLNKIIKYLNDPSLNELDIVEKYSFALVLCMRDSYNYQNNKLKTNGIKQESQGSRSRTYDVSNNSGLSDDIKSCLPLPRVRLL